MSRFFGRHRLGAAHALVVVSSIVSPNGASAEVFVNDALMELSGTGPRQSRDCVAVLKPTLMSDALQAPVLVITTAGSKRLAYGLKDPTRYSDAVIVQDNVRQAFAPGERDSPQHFQSSPLAKGLRADHLFFVTAQVKANSRYVSSRYEGVDFKAVLGRIEEFCPVAPTGQAPDKPVPQGTNIKSCLNVTTKEYGSSAECGSFGRNVRIRTRVRIRPISGCPNEVHVSYFDPVIRKGKTKSVEKGGDIKFYTCAKGGWSVITKYR